jgi:endonuclease/exonuclease/phosphatase (EEP) superfamily protein YafD
VLGGDLNLTHPVVPGFIIVAGHRVDHIAARGLVAAAPATTPERHGLSDHAPVLVDLRKE